VGPGCQLVCRMVPRDGTCRRMHGVSRVAWRVMLVDSNGHEALTSRRLRGRTCVGKGLHGSIGAGAEPPVGGLRTSARMERQEETPIGALLSSAAAPSPVVPIAPRGRVGPPIARVLVAWLVLLGAATRCAQ